MPLPSFRGGGDRNAASSTPSGASLASSAQPEASRGNNASNSNTNASSQHLTPASSTPLQLPMHTAPSGSGIIQPRARNDSPSSFVQGLLRFSPTNPSANATATSAAGHGQSSSNTTHATTSNSGQPVHHHPHPPRFSFSPKHSTSTTTSVNASTHVGNSNHGPSSNRTATPVNTASITSNPPVLSPPVYMDGVPIHQLRQLAQQELHMSSPGGGAMTGGAATSGTTSTATMNNGSNSHQSPFYASLLYSKTHAASDALLLASSYLQNQQYAVCLRVLEEQQHYLQMQYTNSSESAIDAQYYAFYWQALLIACAALAATSDYTTLLQVVEDACRHPTVSFGTNEDNAMAGAHPTMESTGFGSLAAAPGANTGGNIIDDDDLTGWTHLGQHIQSCISPGDSNMIHPLARLLHWRGQAYYETGDGLRATRYWKLALLTDVRIQQAWENLNKRHLLTPKQAYTFLMQHMQFPEELLFLRALYLARIDIPPQLPEASNSVARGVTGETVSGGATETRTGGAVTFATPAVTKQLQLNDSLSTAMSEDESTSFRMPENPTHLASSHGTADGDGPTIQQDVDEAMSRLWNEYKFQNAPYVLALQARRAFQMYDWKLCLQYCEQMDPAVFDLGVGGLTGTSSGAPASEDVAYIYIATLVLLGHERTLFRVAHEWVENCPKSAAAWFAVGAYYYCCQRYHVAQRHFCRATRLDPQSTQAWIAFGCSFAACDESDQALASFRAAQRLSSGEYTSMLYMGMEYVRTNHLVLAAYFLQSALKASGGSDPLCSHELGVLSLQKGELSEAIRFFELALKTLYREMTVEECIACCQDPFWEPTLFNLGHAYRKSRKFAAAEMCFARCVALCPGNHSTYAALGFTKHLMDDTDGAIESYHQALSCKADDPFSTEMLNRALQDDMNKCLRIEDEAENGENEVVNRRISISQKPPRGSTGKGSTPGSLLSPGESSTWSSVKDDSMISEDMESDVDMSAG